MAENSNNTVSVTIKADANDAVKSVGSLKQQLREAQKDVTELSAKFGATSKEAVQAAQKAAELKDAIGDAKALTDAFNPDAKFRAFTSSLSAVAGGFGAVQGALGLVGVESDKVQETLLKVQSAMAISQGLQSIGEGIDSFKQLGAVIKNSTLFQKANNAVTVIATQVQKAFGVAVTGTGTAFKVLKGVIIATGIGALAIGIGLVVDKITSWTSGTDRAKEAQERLNNALEEQNRLYELQQKNLSQARTLALKQAEIANQSADEIFKINTNYNNLELQAAKDNQKKLQKQFADYKKTLIATAAEYNVKLTEQQIEQQGSEDEYYTNLKKQVEQSTEEIKNIEFKSQVDSLDNTIRINKEKENANKKGAEDAKKRIEKQAEEQKKILERQLESSKSLLNLTRDEIRKFEKEQDKENKKIQEERQRQNEINTRQDLAQRIQAASDVNEALSAITTDNIQKSRDQYVALRNFELETGNLSYKQQELIYQQIRELERQKLVDRKATQAEFDLFDKQSKDAEKKREEAAAAAKTQIISGALGGIADAVGRNTVAGKALSVAQASIDTYAGANKALATYPPPFGAIAAGTVILAGLLNVKKILSTKIPPVPGAKGVSDSVSSSLSAAPIAPTAPLVNTRTQLDSTSIQQLGNATSRAYVVESDVTSSQERIRRINRAARLG